MNKPKDTAHLELLRKRAISYRAHKESLEELVDQKTCLSFTICGQSCLLPLESVASLQSNPTLTPLPSAQQNHIGLFSARGTIHEVFCLNSLAGGEAPSDSVILTLQSPHHGVALALESIKGTELLDPKLLRPLESSMGPPGSSAITPENKFLINITTLLTKIN